MEAFLSKNSSQSKSAFKFCPQPTLQPQSIIDLTVEGSEAEDSEQNDIVLAIERAKNWVILEEALHKLSKPPVALSKEERSQRLAIHGAQQNQALLPD